jgi:hypothetical protein
MKMLGNLQRVSVGGKRCACCYPAPKYKKVYRRRLKRRERGNKAWQV